MTSPDQPTKGQRIAEELAQIRELLQAIASALFEIAAANEDREESDRSDTGSTYLDGSPIA